MGRQPLTIDELPPEAELERLARILARFLAGRRSSASGQRTRHRRAGQSMDFLDFRDYQPGDDARGIDWRASHRAGRLQVRRYAGEFASDWYLCLDGSASMHFPEGSNWLPARNLAAALSYLLLYLGHRVGLLLFSTAIDAACPPGRGYRQYSRLLQVLLGYQPVRSGGASDPGACAAAAGVHHGLIVISDFLAEDAMIPTLARLVSSGRQLHVLHLCSPPQIATGGGDALMLEDIESGARMLCSDPAAALVEARRREQQLQDDLAAWCRRFRVPRTLCRGEDNWRDLLLHHFTGG